MTAFPPSLSPRRAPGPPLSHPTPTEVFLSHNWGNDELDRDNHARVSEINTMLTDAGYVTWFDSERMIGDVLEKMADGIDNTQVVLVFITRRYMEKLRTPAGIHDNCKTEFKYAIRRHTEAKVIPVIMDPSMKDSNAWLGPLVRQLRYRF